MKKEELKKGKPKLFSKIFRILPLTIIVLIGVLVLKGMSYAPLIKEEIESAATVTLPKLEPAAGGEEEEKKEEEVLPENVRTEPPEERIHIFTEKERELLEKLSERRKELEEWEKDIAMKANLIEASSKKLDGKIEEMEKLKMTLEEMLVAYQEEEATKIRSLVKIYENMKPKEAAEVFDQLDMKILLEIVDKMSERKAAPILSKMDAKRAKQLTEELAKEQDLAKMAGIKK